MFGTPEAWMILGAFGALQLLLMRVAPGRSFMSSGYAFSILTNPTLIICKKPTFCKPKVTPDQ
jgi:hypothetical protein